MALRELEISQYINLDLLPPKKQEIPSIPELDGKLRQTEEFNVSVEEAKADDKSVSISVSSSEKVICLLLRKMGCDIALPLHEAGISAASVKGTAFHELRALTFLLIQRARERDVQKFMPNEKNPEPYAKMVNRYKIGVGVSVDEALEVAENAWAEFYKDPELVKAVDPREWGEEYKIRQTCYDDGRPLLNYCMTNNYQPHDLNKHDYRKYLEVLWSRKSKYGVQIKGRYDSVYAYEKDGKLHYKIEDLKTGSNNFDVVKQLIHDWQAQIMLLCGEPFCIQYLPTGFLKRRSNIHAVDCPDHYFQKGQDKLESIDYQWYNTFTGQVTIESVSLSGNRNLANEMFTWYGRAVKAYEPEVRAYLKYLKTGEGDPEPTIPRRHRYHSPLVQNTFDFDAKPEEPIVKLLPEDVEEVNRQGEIIDNSGRERVFMGFVGEAQGTCGKCGGDTGLYNVYAATTGSGRITRRVTQEERCMKCGLATPEKYPIKSIPKNRIEDPTYSQDGKPHPTS